MIIVNGIFVQDIIILIMFYTLSWLIYQNSLSSLSIDLNKDCHHGTTVQR